MAQRWSEKSEGGGDEGAVANDSVSRSVSACVTASAPCAAASLWSAGRPEGCHTEGERRLHSTCRFEPGSLFPARQRPDPYRQDPRKRRQYTARVTLVWRTSPPALSTLSLPQCAVLMLRNRIQGRQAPGFLSQKLRLPSAARLSPPAHAAV